MNPAYSNLRAWLTLSVVATLHAVALIGVLSLEPVAQAVGLQQPLMVSLLTIKPPEVIKEIPREATRPSPQPQVQPVKLVQPPVLAVREETPGPVAVAPAPLQPAPVSAVLPPPLAPEPEPEKPVAPAAASVVATAPPPPPSMTPPRFDADYLNNPDPAYPAVSSRLGEQGRVLLRVFVNPDGNPAQVEIRESSGYTRLDKAARDAVLRWRFVPARQGERGIASWVLVPISFSLRS